MASMWSVAKFLTLTTRARTTAGDKETVKVPSPPLPAPVASEAVVIPDKPQSEPAKASPPQLPSRTQSQVVSSVATETSQTPRENIPKESTWTDENTVVHEPEETQSLETKVDSRASSKRQGSTSPSLHDQSDLPTSNPWVDAEPTKLEEEQKDDSPENVPETGDITDAEETLSEKEIPPIDNAPTYAEPQGQKPDLQDLIRKYEIDLAAAMSEKKRFMDDNRRLQDKLRNALHAVDKKTGMIDRLSDEVGRLREDIRAGTLGKEEAQRRAELEKAQMEERVRRETEDVRRACEENEEAARRETQRVKGMIAIERHTHNERVKEFKEEKDELIAALDTAKKETQRIKGLIAVERHTHSERAKEFKEEKDELITALDTAKKETQRIKGLIAVERHSHSERAKGFDDEKHEFIAALDTARKETQRIKGLIAVERHSHSEQVRVIKEEKDELNTELTATRSKVLASVAQIESQKERIRGLEGRLEDNRTVIQKLHDKYYEQESMTKRLQDNFVEERNKVLSQMQSLKAKIVEIQSEANKTEQANRLLREQVTQLQNPVAAVGRFVSSIWS